jgi:excisionase family DNA binding protein
MSGLPTATATYLTAAEAGALLRVSNETLRRWRADPRVNFPRPVQVGRRLLFRADEVAAFLERRPIKARGDGE